MLFFGFLFFFKTIQVKADTLIFNFIFLNTYFGIYLRPNQPRIEMFCHFVKRFYLGKI